MRQTFPQLFTQIRFGELDLSDQFITDNDIEEYFNDSLVMDKLYIRKLILDNNQISKLSSITKMLQYICRSSSLLQLSVRSNDLKCDTENEILLFETRLKEFIGLMQINFSDNLFDQHSITLLQEHLLQKLENPKICDLILLNNPRPDIVPISNQIENNGVSSSIQPLEVENQSVPTSTTIKIYQIIVHRIVHDLFLEKAAHRFTAFNPINNFTNGFNLFAKRIWPLILLSLVAIDWTKFLSSTDERYRTTEKDIWLGTPSDQNALSSMMGDYLEDDIKYWLFPVLALGLGTLFGLSNTIYESCKDNKSESFDEENGDTQPLIVNSQGTRKQNKLMQSFRAYQKWSRGERQPDRYDFAFLGVAGFVITSQIRLIEILIRKAARYSAYRQDKKECEKKQQKKHIYLEDYGDFECVVCPPSISVAPRDSFTSQGCLDGLLSSGKSAQEILSEIDDVIKHADFKVLNLSNFNWQQWTVTQWDLLLDKVSNVVSKLDEINFSVTMSNEVFIDDGKIEYLADYFLSRVTVEKIILRNLNIGEIGMKALMPGILKSKTKYLDVTNNMLGNSGSLYMANYFKESQIETLIVDNNFIGNEGMVSLIENFPLTLRYFSSNHNKYTGEVLKPLGQQLILVPLAGIEIAASDLSDGDTVAFGEDIALSKLKSINIASTNLNQEQVYGFIASAKVGELQKVDISDLALDGDYMTAIMIEVTNTTISAIIANENHFNDSDMENIMEVMPVNIHEFGVAACGYSLRGFQALVNATQPNQLYIFDASRNNLQDSALIYFAKVIKQGNSYWHRVNLSGNGFTDIGGVAFCDALAQGKVKDSILSANQFGDATLMACSPWITSSNASRVLFDKNRFSPGAIASFIKATKDTALKEFSCDVDLAAGDVGVEIAKIMLTKTPGIDKVGEKKISRAEARALRRAKPVTPLESIYFPNSLFSPASELAMRRVLPSLPNTNIAYKK